VSSFAKQIIEAKKGKRNKVVCGNIDIIRDFIDVRDAIRAYECILQKGKNGEIYNVCSGEGHALSEILVMLQEIAQTHIPIEINRSLFRPADNPIIIGCGKKLSEDTGFKRQYGLPRSLTDILEYWDRLLL